MKKGINEPVVDGWVVRPLSSRGLWGLAGRSVWLCFFQAAGMWGAWSGFHWPSGFQFLCYFG